MTTRITTYQQVADWIAKLPEDKDDKRTLDEKAMWFFAYQRAEGFRDFTTKDFAEMILAGEPPMTKADVEEELAATAEEDPDFDLTEELTNFWRA